MNEEKKEGKKKFLLVKLVVLVLLAVFLVISIFKAFKEYKYIGSELGNTIIVNGEGKIERSPDTAKINFSINNESRILADAQKNVDDKFAKVKTELEAVGILEKDISTERYSTYPKYTYQDNRAPILRGYEVSHSVLVKVKDLEKVSSVIEILGKNTVNDLSGPNFGFDDDKAIAREARELAIEDAKDQAEKLAKDLGVKLVRIVSFNESGGSVYLNRNNLMAKQEMAMASFDSAMNTAPSVAIGEREVMSNVTIVYEIR